MKAGLMLGVNPESKREDNDFYATHPSALEVFLDRIEGEVVLNKNIWECACGQKHLSRVLESRGYDVRNSDLIKRLEDTDIIEKSFLEFTEVYEGDILTNPPFKLATEFLEKGMELLKTGNKILMFLKIQFLESQSRKALFKKFPPKYVYCYSQRQQCSMNADFENLKATTQFYAWYVWEKGFDGETILRWI